ncbi:MAG: transcriptional regulator [Alphaproteobacteria bacterium HGW-Alphaproteobacteria-11]|nr:MAG: transcriptional regulator [Alphaproteobacteria bacterium HGW-Alphaproteobacteria-11]
MAKTKKESRILDEVREAAKDLYDAGAIDVTTMREFDALCLPQVPHYTSSDIKKIRRANRASQSVFAAYLNVSKATVTAWEQGLKEPSSMGLKLLNLVDRKGIGTLA